MEIKKIIKSHIGAILMALVVGAISIAPQLYVLRDPNYKGVQMFGADAEYDYVAKINKAYYDNYSRGPFPPDPGKDYYLAPELGERTMAFFGKMTHLTAIGINIAAKFIFPFILFLILYCPF